jgi:hypothetical protein
MKKAIIISVVIIILAAIVVGVLFFLKNRAATTAVGVGSDTGLLPGSTGGNTETQQSSTANNPGSTSGAAIIPFGDAAVTGVDISPGAPADAPQGPTLQFQAASGTVTLNNFYNSAQGYWIPFDMLLIQSNASYAIWYYRDSSEFEIDIPTGGTFTDEDNAASQLARILGVGQQELCSLPVTAVFEIDQGNDDEVYPLNFCSAHTL